MTIKQQGGIFGRNPEFNKVSLPDDGQINFGNSDDLSIYHNGSASYVVDSGTGNLFVQGNNLALKNADSSKSYMFATNGGDVSLYYDGGVKFQTKTGGAKVVGNLEFNSGNGIDFSATAGTGTSELLSDYEEGLWTPVIIGGTTAGTGTYSQQDGVYTKVGNLVTVSCYLAFTAHTGTGHMKVSGLPFAGVGSSVDFQAGATQAQYINAGTSATQLAASVVTTASNISLYGFVNNAAKVATQVNASGSGSQLAITLTYRTS